MHTTITLLQTGNDPVVLIKHLFNQEQCELIFNEILRISSAGLLRAGHNTHSDVTLDGNHKVNFSVWLHSIFDPGKSTILETIKSKFKNLELVDILIQQHYVFKYIAHSKAIHTLLSYYTTNNNYHPHRDNAAITGLSYFWKEPKMFEGGDLIFPETGLSYTPEFGDTILFPSFTLHGVTSVKMNSTESFSGRFVISNFFAAS